MSWRARVADWIAPERRAVSSRDPYLAEYFGVRNNEAGQIVTPERATGIAAVHACVQLIAETIATLPLAPFRRLEGGGREIDRDHSLYRVLHEQANAVQTAVEFREQLIASCLLTGNSYALKVLDGSGAVRELIPLHPGDVRPEKLVNGRVRYEVGFGNGREVYTQDEVMHLRYRSRDGYTGLSPITVARETVGVALAQQEHEGRLYRHGLAINGAVMTEQPLTAEQMGQLQKSMEAGFTGPNKFRLLVMSHGLKFEPIAMTHEDAQFVESRRLTIEDIARIFRVPPPAIGDLTRATYSNITEQNRWLVAYTLRPWLVRLEQTMNASLLSQDGRQTHFLEHNVEGLLRGDQRERYESYRIGREWGWLNVNEIRARENLNPVSGGDEYRVPMNTEATTEA